MALSAVVNLCFSVSLLLEFMPHIQAQMHLLTNELCHTSAIRKPCTNPEKSTRDDVFSTTQSEGINTWSVKTEWWWCIMYIKGPCIKGLNAVEDNKLLARQISCCLLMWFTSAHCFI